VGSPEFHFSGAGFNIRNPDFTAEKIVKTDLPVESLSSVNFQVINGEVVVTGYRDVDAIVMTAHLIVGSDSQADADSHIDDLEIQVTESAEEILFQTVQPQYADGRKYDVKYDVMVPSGLSVMVTQVNGTIEIIDIENSVDVANTNGDVLLSNIVGGVSADVVNGSIAANVTLPVHETIDLIIDNGSIELHIPRFTSAVFGASVGIGAINTLNLAFDDVVQADQSLTGTLGNGEGVIELWVGNGDINVVGYD
jgi:DUF4097 and DUF4098 domain-containing protein YvlB